MLISTSDSHAKVRSWPRNNNIEPNRESTKPMHKLRQPSCKLTLAKDLLLWAYHPMNPYNRWVRERFKKLNAESPSNNWFSGTILVADSRLNHPFDDITLFSSSWFVFTLCSVRGMRLFYNGVLREIMSPWRYLVEGWLSPQRLLPDLMHHNRPHLSTAQYKCMLRDNQ